MESLLAFYLQHQEWINLIKDITFFAGALTFFRGAYLFFKYLRNRKFKEKSEDIDKNIKFREQLEPALNEYIFDTAKGTKDICIRFVHWKNYPWNLDEDGFKFLLRINYIEKPPHYGWIDNTGVNFEEPIWFCGNSVYLDENGLFFFDKKGQTHKGFKEYSDVVLVLHMPFSNIVNYDFRERIEYEPVFYIKHPYIKWKKLYSDQINIRERQGKDWVNIELSQSKMIKKYSALNYRLFKLKYFVLRIITKNSGS